MNHDATPSTAHSHDWKVHGYVAEYDDVARRRLVAVAQLQSHGPGSVALFSLSNQLGVGGGGVGCEANHTHIYVYTYTPQNTTRHGTTRHNKA